MASSRELLMENQDTECGQQDVIYSSPKKGQFRYNILKERPTTCCCARSKGDIWWFFWWLLVLVFFLLLAVAGLLLYYLLLAPCQVPMGFQKSWAREACHSHK